MIVCLVSHGIKWCLISSFASVINKCTVQIIAHNVHFYVKGGISLPLVGLTYLISSGHWLAHYSGQITRICSDNYIYKYMYC